MISSSQCNIALFVVLVWHWLLSRLDAMFLWSRLTSQLQWITYSIKKTRSSNVVDLDAWLLQSIWFCHIIWRHFTIPCYLLGWYDFVDFATLFEGIWLDVVILFTDSLFLFLTMLNLCFIIVYSTNLKGYGDFSLFVGILLVYIINVCVCSQIYHLCFSDVEFVFDCNISTNLNEYDLFSKPYIYT